MVQNVWERVRDGLREFGLPQSSQGTVLKLAGGVVDPSAEFMRGGKRRG